MSHWKVQSPTPGWKRNLEVKPLGFDRQSHPQGFIWSDDGDPSEGVSLVGSVEVGRAILIFTFSS